MSTGTSTSTGYIPVSQEQPYDEKSDIEFDNRSITDTMQVVDDKQDVHHNLVPLDRHTDIEVDIDIDIESSLSSTVQRDDNTTSTTNTNHASSGQVSDKRHYHGKHIAWKSVSYRVKQKNILQDCWGEVHPGEMCVIMGPSGSGKTSLLNILAGRLCSTGNSQVQGCVTIDGQEINPVAYRRNIAYCMQENALLSTSTPREAITFSAKLRLPPTLTDKEVEDKVNSVMTDLGIMNCADTRIGGEFVKGISGGEMKRTSVAIEIITEPNILFLDEPTSGLDSFSALHMTMTLKHIAQRSCTVLCTIHQPSSQLFFLFDRVLYLKDGIVFHQGHRSQVLEYFSLRGFDCPLNFNPSDFVMSLCYTLTVEEMKSKRGRANHRKHVTGEESESKGGIDSNEGKGKEKGESEEEESKLMMIMTEMPSNFMSSITTLSSKLYDASIIDFSAESSFFKQLSLIVQREFQKTIRDYASIKAKVRITIVLNLLFGIIFFQSGKVDNGQMDQFAEHSGALTLIVLFNLVGAGQGMILTLPYEIPMILREYATGTYGLLACFLGRLLVEMPIMFIQDLVQMIIVYNMMGLQGSFIYLLLACYGLAMVSNSVAMIVSTVASNMKRAAELVPMAYMPQILFAGYFVRTSQIPVFLRWAQYIVGMKYCLSLVYLAEFNSKIDSCNTSVSAQNMCQSILDSNDIDQEHFYIYIIMLFVLFLVFRGISVFILIEKAKLF